jgi:Peptidase MA superfamily
MAVRTSHVVRRGLLRAAVLLAGSAWLATGHVASAAGAVSFGTPTATSTFGSSVVFVQPVTVTGQVRRTEILLAEPGGDGPFVQPVDLPSGTPPRELRYSIDAATDHIYPNTVIGARWRVVLDDGSTVVGPSVSVRYDDTRFEWRTLSASIVRVHWYNGPDSFGQRARDIGQKAIDATSSLLGVTETQPVDFYVYADQQAFYDALGPGTRENVGGEANADIRTMFALITPAEINAAWVSIVIPHELTHLVFNTAVQNPYHFPPRWLNEGLAVYLSQGYDSADRGAVEGAARDGSLMPLDALIGQFPTTADRFSLAYAESVSSVDFLVRKYGRSTLVALVRSYAGGLSDDEAFKGALGVNVGDFEKAWLSDIDAIEPKVAGPVSAPPGPLPPGWSGGSGSAVQPGVGASAPPEAPAPTAGGSGGGSGAGELPAIMAGIILAAVILVVGLVMVSRRRASGTNRE